MADLDPGLAVCQAPLRSMHSLGGGNAQPPMFGCCGSDSGSLECLRLHSRPRAACAPCAAGQAAPRASGRLQLPWPWAPSLMFPSVPCVAPGLVSALLWWALDAAGLSGATCL